MVKVGRKEGEEKEHGGAEIERERTRSRVVDYVTACNKWRPKAESHVCYICIESSHLSKPFSMVGKYDARLEVHPTINDAVIIHTQKLRGRG